LCRRDRKSSARASPSHGFAAQLEQLAAKQKADAPDEVVYKAATEASASVNAERSRIYNDMRRGRPRTAR
jgi:hypothetical protein